MKQQTTSRTMQATQTKDKIFQTATHLFVEKGYDHVTVSEIARHSGIAKGTFYVHFDSKHAILQEAFHRADIHYQRIDQQMPSDLPSFEKILILLKSFCSYTLENIGLESLQIIYATDTLSKEKESILINPERYIYTAINRILQEGVEKGEFRKSFDAWRCTLRIMRFFRGLILDWCILHGDFDLVDECEHYFKDVFLLFVQQVDAT